MPTVVKETPTSTAVMETVTNVTVTPSIHDDASDLEAGSAKPFDSRRSTMSKEFVYTPKPKGPRVIVQVGFYEGLPNGFIESFMPVSIPLSSIVTRGTDGEYTYEHKWITTRVLPKVWDKVESVLSSYGASVTDLSTLKSMFDDGSRTSQKEAVSKLLTFYLSDESADPMTVADLRPALEAFEASRCDSFHWRLYFSGQAAALIRDVFTSSLSLLNDVHLYALKEGATPERLSEIMGAAVETQVASLKLPTNDALDLTVVEEEQNPGFNRPLKQGISSSKDASISAPKAVVGV